MKDPSGPPTVREDPGTDQKHDRSLFVIQRNSSFHDYYLIFIINYGVLFICNFVIYVCTKQGCET